MSTPMEELDRRIARASRKRAQTGERLRTQGLKRIERNAIIGAQNPVEGVKHTPDPYEGKNFLQREFAAGLQDFGTAADLISLGVANMIGSEQDVSRNKAELVSSQRKAEALASPEVKNLLDMRSGEDLAKGVFGTIARSMPAMMAGAMTGGGASAASVALRSSANALVKNVVTANVKKQVTRGAYKEAMQGPTSATFGQGVRSAFAPKGAKALEGAKTFPVYGQANAIPKAYNPRLDTFNRAKTAAYESRDATRALTSFQKGQRADAIRAAKIGGGAAFGVSQMAENAHSITDPENWAKFEAGVRADRKTAAWEDPLLIDMQRTRDNQLEWDGDSGKVIDRNGQMRDIRLAGINSADKGQAGYNTATEYLRQMMDSGQDISIASTGEKDKYGREMVHLYRRGDEESINEQLLDAGVVTPLERYDTQDEYKRRGQEAVKKGAVLYGSRFTSQPQNAADVFTHAKEYTGKTDGLSLGDALLSTMGTSMAQGALEMIPVAGVLGRMGNRIKNGVTDGLGKRVLKAGAYGAAQETWTEETQTLLGHINDTYVSETGFEMSPERRDQYINALIAAPVGFVMGGLGGIPNKRASKETAPETKTETAPEGRFDGMETPYIPGGATDSTKTHQPRPSGAGRAETPMQGAPLSKQDIANNKDRAAINEQMAALQKQLDQDETHTFENVLTPEVIDAIGQENAQAIANIIQDSYDANEVIYMSQLAETLEPSTLSLDDRIETLGAAIKKQQKVVDTRMQSAEFQSAEKGVRAPQGNVQDAIGALSGIRDRLKDTTLTPEERTVLEAQQEEVATTITNLVNAQGEPMNGHYMMLNTLKSVHGALTRQRSKYGREGSSDFINTSAIGDALGISFNAEEEAALQDLELGEVVAPEGQNFITDGELKQAAALMEERYGRWSPKPLDVDSKLFKQISMLPGWEYQTLSQLYADEKITDVDAYRNMQQRWEAMSEEAKTTLVTKLFRNDYPNLTAAEAEAEAADLVAAGALTPKVVQTGEGTWELNPDQGDASISTTEAVLDYMSENLMVYRRGKALSEEVSAREAGTLTMEGMDTGSVVQDAGARVLPGSVAHGALSKYQQNPSPANLKALTERLSRSEGGGKASVLIPFMRDGKAQVINLAKLIASVPSDRALPAGGNTKQLSPYERVMLKSQAVLADIMVAPEWKGLAKSIKALQQVKPHEWTKKKGQWPGLYISNQSHANITLDQLLSSTVKTATSGRRSDYPMLDQEREKPGRETGQEGALHGDRFTTDTLAGENKVPTSVEEAQRKDRSPFSKQQRSKTERAAATVLSKKLAMEGEMSPASQNMLDNVIALSAELARLYKERGALQGRANKTKNPTEKAKLTKELKSKNSAITDRQSAWRHALRARLADVLNKYEMHTDAEVAIARDPQLQQLRKKIEDHNLSWTSEIPDAAPPTKSEQLQQEYVMQFERASQMQQLRMAQEAAVPGTEAYKHAQRVQASAAQELGLLQQYDKRVKELTENPIHKNDPAVKSLHGKITSLLSLLFETDAAFGEGHFHSMDTLNFHGKDSEILRVLGITEFKTRPETQLGAEGILTQESEKYGTRLSTETEAAEREARAAARKQRATKKARAVNARKIKALQKVASQGSSRTPAEIAAAVEEEIETESRVQEELEAKTRAEAKATRKEQRRRKEAAWAAQEANDLVAEEERKYGGRLPPKVKAGPAVELTAEERIAETRAEADRKHWEEVHNTTWDGARLGSREEFIAAEQSAVPETVMKLKGRVRRLLAKRPSPSEIASGTGIFVGPQQASILAREIREIKTTISILLRQYEAAKEAALDKRAQQGVGSSKQDLGTLIQMQEILLAYDLDATNQFPVSAHTITRAQKSLANLAGATNLDKGQTLQRRFAEVVDYLVTVLPLSTSTRFLSDGQYVVTYAEGAPRSGRRVDSDNMVLAQVVTKTVAVPAKEAYTTKAGKKVPARKAGTKKVKSLRRINIKTRADVATLLGHLQAATKQAGKEATNIEPDVEAAKSLGVIEYSGQSNAEGDALYVPYGESDFLAHQITTDGPISTEAERAANQDALAEYRAAEKLKAHPAVTKMLEKMRKFLPYGIGDIANAPAEVKAAILKEREKPGYKGIAIMSRSNLYLDINPKLKAKASAATLIHEVSHVAWAVIKSSMSPAARKALQAHYNKFRLARDKIGGRHVSLDEWATGQLSAVMAEEKQGQKILSPVKEFFRKTGKKLKALLKEVYSYAVRLSGLKVGEINEEAGAILWAQLTKAREETQLPAWDKAWFAGEEADAAALESVMQALMNSTPEELEARTADLTRALETASEGKPVKVAQVKKPKGKGKAKKKPKSKKPKGKAKTKAPKKENKRKKGSKKENKRKKKPTLSKKQRHSVSTAKAVMTKKLSAVKAAMSPETITAFKKLLKARYKNKEGDVNPEVAAFISHLMTSTNAETRRAGMQSVWHGLLSPEDRGTLQRGLNTPHVRKQVREAVGEELWTEITKDDSDLGADMGLYMAYAYDQWSMNQLQLGPKTGKSLRTILEWLGKFLGITTEAQQSEQLFNELRKAESELVARKVINPNVELHSSKQLADTYVRRAVSVTRSVAEVFAKGGSYLVPEAMLALRTKNGQVRRIVESFFASVNSEGVKVSYDEAIQMQMIAHNTKLANMFEGVSDKVRTGWAFAVRTGTEASDPQVRELVEQTHKYLGDLYNTLTSAGVPMNKIQAGFFPRHWNADFIGEHQEEFIADLLEHSNINTVAEAERIVASIQKDEGFFEPDMEFQYQETMGSTKKRGILFGTENRTTSWKKGKEASFRDPKIARLEQLMDRYKKQDALQSLSEYTRLAVKKAEFSRRFGASGHKLRSMIRAAKATGMTDRTGKQLNRFIDAQLGVPLYEINPKLREAMGWAQTMFNFSLLGGIMFASAPDMVLPVMAARGQKGLMPKFYATMGRELSNKIAKEGKSEQRKMAELFGTVENKLFADVMQQRVNSTFLSAKQRSLNDKFFGMVGISGYTRVIRTAATTIGVEFIKDNKDNKQALAELGLKPEDIEIRDDGTLRVGTLEDTNELLSSIETELAERNSLMFFKEEVKRLESYIKTSDNDAATKKMKAEVKSYKAKLGKNADARIAELTKTIAPVQEEIDTMTRVRGGVVRFVNRASMRPNPATRPAAIANNPYLMLIWYLKDFLYSALEVVHKQAAHIVKSTPLMGKETRSMLYTLLLFGPLFMIGEEFRDLLQHRGGEDPSKIGDTNMDKLMYAYKRSGLFAVWETGFDAADAAEKDKNMFRDLLGPPVNRIASSWQAFSSWNTESMASQAKKMIPLQSMLLANQVKDRGE